MSCYLLVSLISIILQMMNHDVALWFLIIPDLQLFNVVFR